MQELEKEKKGFGSGGEKRRERERDFIGVWLSCCRRERERALLLCWVTSVALVCCWLLCCYWCSAVPAGCSFATSALLPCWVVTALVRLFFFFSTTPVSWAWEWDYERDLGSNWRDGGSWIFSPNFCIWKKLSTSGTLSDLAKSHATRLSRLGLGHGWVRSRVRLSKPCS